MRTPNNHRTLWPLARGSAASDFFQDVEATLNKLDVPDEASKRHPKDPSFVQPLADVLEAELLKRRKH